MTLTGGNTYSVLLHQREPLLFLANLVVAFADPLERTRQPVLLQQGLYKRVHRVAFDVTHFAGGQQRWQLGLDLVLRLHLWPPLLQGLDDDLLRLGNTLTVGGAGHIMGCLFGQPECVNPGWTSME